MNADPINRAKGLTSCWMKDIHRFDGLEILPVRNVRTEELHNDEIPPEPDCCEPCEPCDAHFWSVYGHLKEGHVECFEDFDTESEARAFAQKLYAAYPLLHRPLID